MSSEEVRRRVQYGLNELRADRKAREGKLEQYELDMIRRLNAHCSDAKKNTASREREEARRVARAAARAKEQELEEKATLAVLRYIRACVGSLLLVGFTSFPWWAAVVLTLGLAVFPVAYIFRLYVPLEVRV